MVVIIDRWSVSLAVTGPPGPGLARAMARGQLSCSNWPLASVRTSYDSNFSSITDPWTTCGPGPVQ